jgi:hypothetical protein
VPLADLDEREREVVRECLRATVDGPFYPDWEFETLFGLTRDEVRRILMAWPFVDDSDRSVSLAINNSFNNLLGYPAENMEEHWPKFISVGGPELARIFEKWKGRASRSGSSARSYFDDMM